jgi:hypothetical protein
VRAPVYRDECSYVYEYLRLYCVSNFFCQIWFNFITYFYFTYAKRQKILFVTFILDPILENSWICFKLQCKVNLPLRTVENY